MALAVVTIESGGWFLLRVVTGRAPATDFQRSFYRAGHAHAGVLVTLGLVCLLLGEATSPTGGRRWLAQTGVLVGAVLLPAGFFLSAAGAGRTRPNRLVVLLPLGAPAVAAGVVSLGIGLLTARGGPIHPGVAGATGRHDPGRRGTGARFGYREDHGDPYDPRPRASHACLRCVAPVTQGRPAARRVTPGGAW